MARHFSAEGWEIIETNDPFDQEKDFGIRKGPNTFSVEVKLQELYEGIKNGPGRYFSGFTVGISEGQRVHKNQLSKCLTVDRLVFVRRPKIHYPIIELYEAPSPGKRHFIIYQNSNDKRIVAAFDASHMTKIASYDMPNDLVQKFMLRTKGSNKQC